jgi:pSer/pThr/pTyr-binding forkhead associated (FHA) protein
MDDHTLFPQAAPAAPRLADVGPELVPLRLVLHPGGLAVELDQPDMLVGRHSTADVRLSLPDVSRKHCRFVFADCVWKVFDLNSLNGTYINGERLHESPVFHGDKVRIGSLTFEVELGHADGPGTRKATHLVTRDEDQEMRKAG